MSIAERAIHLQQLCACEQARMIFSSSALAQAPSVSCEEPLNFQPNLLIFQPVFSLELLAQKGQCQTLWLQQNAGLKGHRTTLVMTQLCSLQWRLMALVAFGLFILSDATGKPHFLAHLLGENTVWLRIVYVLKRFKNKRFSRIFGLSSASEFLLHLIFLFIILSLNWYFPSQISKFRCKEKLA